MRAATPPPVFPGLTVTVQAVTIERAEFDLTLDVTDEADEGADGRAGIQRRTVRAGDDPADGGAFADAPGRHRR